METILTPKDVFDFGSANINIEENLLCSFISVEEEAFFNSNKCLGWDYYEYLKTDLLLPTLSVVFFENGELYFVGDYVSFNGRVYRCVIDTTGEQDPENSSNFERIKKFITQASNDIWERYIARALSWSVLISTGDISAVTHSANGLIRQKGDNFQPATLAEVESRKRMYMSQRSDLMVNMQLFLERNKDLYPQTEFYKETCGCKKCENPNSSLNSPTFFDRVLTL
jgi:hypothetical protein